jgi:type VI secretion system secreted protein Hcp
VGSTQGAAALAPPRQLFRNGGRMPEPKRKSSLASLFGRLLLTGMVAAAVTAPSAALAAEDLFLKLEGIQGESTDSQHNKEIVLLSYSQSFTNPASGGGAKANCGTVTVTKLVDKSSPALIGAVLSARNIATAVITFRKAGAAPLEYYKVTLTEVLLEAIIQTDSSPTDPTTILEQVSMSASKFKFEYTPQKADGSFGGVVSFAWDCKLSKQG